MRGLRSVRNCSTATQTIGDFDAFSAQLNKRNKGQTLRLYNPETHQWSTYLVDVDQGTLGLPPVIGEFVDKRGEFFNQDTYKGRAIYLRHVWLDISPRSSRMEQSWYSDGGKTWEVNWICERSS